MKKTILLLFGFLSTGIFAQSQYTVEQTEKSNDPKVVANFIINYPNHPKTPEFRRKLARLGSSSSSAQTSTSHQSNSYRSHQETAEEATRILNGSSKGNSAYVTVKNLSKCPIVVNFTGKSSYNMSVPANSTINIRCKIKIKSWKFLQLFYLIILCIVPLPQISLVFVLQVHLQ